MNVVLRSTGSITERPTLPHSLASGTDDECRQRDLGDHQRIRHERLVNKLVTAVTTSERVVVCNADRWRLAHGHNELLRQWLD